MTLNGEQRRLSRAALKKSYRYAFIESEVQEMQPLRRLRIAIVVFNELFPDGVVRAKAISGHRWWRLYTWSLGALFLGHSCPDLKRLSLIHHYASYAEQVAEKRAQILAKLLKKHGVI